MILAAKLQLFWQIAVQLFKFNVFSSIKCYPISTKTLKEICKICGKIFHRTFFEVVFRVNEVAVVGYA